MEFAFQLGDRVIVNETTSRHEWIGRTGTIVGYDPGREYNRENPWCVRFDDQSYGPNGYNGLRTTSLDLIDYEDKVRKALKELEELVE